MKLCVISHGLRCYRRGRSAGAVRRHRRARRKPAPIRFIVGLAPGGASTPMPASIAEHMAKTLGQPDHRREQARRDRQHLARNS